MITSDTTALITSVVSVPIPLIHVSNFLSNSKGISPDYLFKAEKNLLKKMREDVMNSVVNQLNVSKLKVNFSIDREGEHQMDCYTIFDLPSRYFARTYSICVKTHWYLNSKW
ncbi:5491_t:CDS:2 [Funneliformis mosseae]|uniref:5491_t:CDS:1 n=1 Tax=Funneliformis mosseae TaxID=27381 RepID=A0A9N9DWC5_FUNMO|nr:5491_t:CDS:2 [Funneliformis mosseae]